MGECGLCDLEVPPKDVGGLRDFDHNYGKENCEKLQMYSSEFKNE
jgi:hypothetical protein